MQFAGEPVGTMARPRRVEAPVLQPLNRRFGLAGRPHGMPIAAKFRPEAAPNPDPGGAVARAPRLSTDRYRRRAIRGRRTTVGEALVRIAGPLEVAS